MKRAKAKKSMGGRAVLPFTPREHQRDVHEKRSRRRWSVLVWHRRAGKTVFAVVELVLAAAAFSAIEGKFAYICPLLKQAREVAWGYLKRFTRAIPGTKINESDLSVTFANGAIVRLYGADNPDALRGAYFDGVVMDEVGQMKRFLWGEIVRPMLMDRHGWGLFIGTPKGVNLFSEIFFDSQKPENAETWFSDLRTCYETDAIKPEEIEAAKAEMSEAQFSQEMLCDFFAAVENCLMSLDDVEAATKRKLRPEVYAWAPRVIGVDVARFGDDETVIVRRQGRVVLEPERHRGMNTMQLAGRVGNLADEWQADAIFVDVTGGLGAGPVDRLRELGYPVIGVDFGSKSTSPRYLRKRSEMWCEMGDWLKEGWIPEDQKLKQELVAATYEFDSSGRKVLHDKDEIKERIGRSPDSADALACTFASPVAARKHQGARKNSAITDYDPYSKTTDQPRRGRAVVDYDLYSRAGV